LLRVKVLHVNVSTCKYEVKEYGNVLGPLDLGIELHLNYYKSYGYEVFNPNNVVVLGKGPFVGGGLFGAHRLVFVFRSPVTKGLYASTLGGAAYAFMGVGVDALVIEGKSEHPLIIFLKSSNDGEISVRFEVVDKIHDIYHNYDGFKGVRALVRYILSNYWNFIKDAKARIAAVGPASFNSVFGAIYSPVIDYVTRKILVEDWAARGGPGSVLAQAHNVAAIVFGGDNYKLIPKILRRFDSVSGIVTAILGESYVKKVIETTSKYSYDLDVRSGGTFGSNYKIYKEKVPYFNWRTLELSSNLRRKIYDIIINYLWKPFNEKVISSGIWHTCGEPCIVKCKKVDERGRKIDYEPYNGLGPQLGIFNFDDVSDVVDLADTYGYDAIELGNILAFLFEALSKNLLRPDELGLDGKPHYDPETYNPKYSSRNALVAIKIIENMTLGKSDTLKVIAREGLRTALKKLSKSLEERTKKVGLKFEDIAVYVPYGDYGYITPNYYISPGVLAPLAVLGRYWTLYSLAFMDPEEYAAAALDRALKEYLLDNAGLCRFYRRWVEKHLQDLYKIVYGVEVDLMKHAKEYYKKVIEYQAKSNALPRFWESTKVIKLLESMACEYGSKEWCEKFKKSPKDAALEWWSRFVRYLSSNLGVKFT